MKWSTINLSEVRWDRAGQRSNYPAWLMRSDEAEYVEEVWEDDHLALVLLRSSEAHLTIVFGALAVVRWLEARTGVSIEHQVQPLRR